MPELVKDRTVGVMGFLLWMLLNIIHTLNENELNETC